MVLSVVVVYCVSLCLSLSLLPPQQKDLDRATYKQVHINSGDDGVQNTLSSSRKLLTVTFGYPASAWSNRVKDVWTGNLDYDLPNGYLQNVLTRNNWGPITGYHIVGCWHHPLINLWQEELNAGIQR